MYYKMIEEVIPEHHIVCVSPHYDDFLFFLGGYVLELQKKGQLQSKKFTNISTFSRSNYQERDTEGNKDQSLKRVQYATGIRFIEDLECLDALLGAHGYQYRVMGEEESQVRGKAFNEGDGEMEMAFGSYETMDDKDRAILARMTTCICELASRPDTAIVLPLSMKGHIDHFIVREAGVAAMKQTQKGGATFYFAEDKPYAGLMSAEESEINDIFIAEHQLKARAFAFDGEEVLRLAYLHYPSQVDEVYNKGVVQRSDMLAKHYGKSHGCDRIYTK